MGFTVGVAGGTGVDGAGVGDAGSSDGGAAGTGVVVDAPGVAAGPVVAAGGGSVATGRGPELASPEFPVLPLELEPPGRGNAATWASVSLRGVGVAEGLGEAAAETEGGGVAVFVLPDLATSALEAASGDSGVAGRAAFPPELV